MENHSQIDWCPFPSQPFFKTIVLIRQHTISSNNYFFCSMWVSRGGGVVVALRDRHCAISEH